MVDDLSPFQLEIAREVAVRTYAEAAAVLHLSVPTVRYHTNRIMLIIGAKRKDDIARILLAANEL